MMEKGNKNKIGAGLQSIFHFTDEDLLANRQGYLSKAQISQFAGLSGGVPINAPTWLERYGWHLYIALFGAVGMLCGILMLISRYWMGIFIILAAVTLLLMVKSTFNLGGDYVYHLMRYKQKVASLQGVPTLDTARRQGVYYPALKVRRHKLIIQPEQVALLRDFFETTGDYPFIFYYWNPSRRVLSAEPVNVDSDFFFESLEDSAEQ